MNLLKLTTLFLTLLVLTNSFRVISEHFFNTGEQYVYTKSIEVKYYTSRFIEKTYSSILRGYCIEESKYIITGTSSFGFSIEKRVLRIRNESASRVICGYLEIFDQGIVPLQTGNESETSKVFVFTWDFEYSGPVFYTIEYMGVELPWFNNTYIYIPPRYVRDIVEFEKTIASTKLVDGKLVSFHYIFSFNYNPRNGLLNKLECLITIMLDKNPYILLRIVIESSKDSVLQIVFKNFAEYIVSYWKYIVSALLAIIVLVVILKKVF